MNQPIKIQEKSPMLVSQLMRKRYYKTLGTSVINSLMSPPSPVNNQIISLPISIENRLFLSRNFPLLIYIYSHLFNTYICNNSYYIQISNFEDLQKGLLYVPTSYTSLFESVSVFLSV